MTRREELRLAALDRAITLHTVGASDDAVLATAARFEAYLNGDGVAGSPAPDDP